MIDFNRGKDEAGRNGYFTAAMWQSHDLRETAAIVDKCYPGRRAEGGSDQRRKLGRQMREQCLSFLHQRIDFVVDELFCSAPACQQFGKHARCALPENSA